MKPTSNSRSEVPRIALTCGEPAGIGPELCLAVARAAFACDLVCLGDSELLTERARRIDSRVTLRRYDPHARVRHTPGTLAVEHHALGVASAAGVLDVRNVPYVLQVLDRAVDGALAREFDAIVTAPVHKGLINDAGTAFTGHTEYLAQRTHTARAVMMLTTGELRVALATTHLPLKDVSAALNVEMLCEVLGILHHDLTRRWGLAAPRIAVCGVNPHAGEGGYLGDEETRIIAPAIERMRARAIQASGPVPADTIFVPHILANYDAVLAMYHDQGLPVVKHVGFENAVNVTLGLPIVRTSVDHGTALELAGSGRADAGSFTAAVHLALQLATPPAALG
ncbi:MAG TPA: 4-hydroxythreonine-4-phosphate dehydrogenase PdxA [Steroidobacteraceae bacterium]|jgi:4-hydroxythreonine-4-phosphate dehydrogenase|nr:4-hydroxythreonine-4-phosphate dehydrogenase PdxA [Steroidobacteraceae bacterium]